jgi:hypothetical protein
MATTWCFVAIATLSCGLAHKSEKDVPEWVPDCIMSNTQAVNGMIDSALFIYASTKACTGAPGETASCVSNLAEVVHSVIGVGEFMIKVFETCGEIKTSNLNCGLAGAHLTGALASVTSSASAAADDCAPPGDSIEATGKYKVSYSSLDTCTINVADAMSGLQAAITATMAMKGKCAKADHVGTCVTGVLDMISCVGNLAVFIENVVADCKTDGESVSNACATDIGGILAGLAATASSVGKVRESCTAKSSLLYTEHSAGMKEPATFGSANILSGMLLVLLPITGLVSYFGGARFTKGSAPIRHRPGPQSARQLSSRAAFSNLD